MRTPLIFIFDITTVNLAFPQQSHVRQRRTAEEVTQVSPTAIFPFLSSDHLAVSIHQSIVRLAVAVASRFRQAEKMINNTWMHSARYDMLTFYSNHDQKRSTQYLIMKICIVVCVECQLTGQLAFKHSKKRSIHFFNYSIYSPFTVIKFSAMPI